MITKNGMNDEIISLSDNSYICCSYDNNFMVNLYVDLSNGSDYAKFECIPLVDIEKERINKVSPKGMANKVIVMIEALTEQDYDLYALKMPDYDELVRIIEDKLEGDRLK